ncbi:hypothetical protein JCM3770_001821 [Rhodotorula araucariae]
MASTPPDTRNHSDTHTFLPDHVSSWRCATCTLELAVQDELVSRAFQGATGPAFLWRTVINAEVGAKTSKELLSGKHLIAPLTCRGCSTEIGWQYVRTTCLLSDKRFTEGKHAQFVSPSSAQKYKEGKCILEKSKIYKDNKWSVDAE